MPWDALHSHGLLCFAIALGFLGLGALHMHDWRADEVSFSLQTPFLALEGTLRDRAKGACLRQHRGRAVGCPGRV